MEGSKLATKICSMSNSPVSHLPFLLVFICCIWSSRTLANSGYLVAVPSELRPGTDEVLSVTILKPSEPILVEAKLFSKSSELLTSTGHEIFGKGTLTLKIPRNVKGKCTLKICGNCVAPREGSYTFYNSTVIEVKEKGTSVFIQTDKPIYKPGQRVYINMITTDPDLRPVNENLFAYIEDPHGSRMIQWKDLQPPCCGVANVSYPISDQPVLGVWRVAVHLQGQVYNRTFEIQKYVLPRYDVIIDPPRFIRDWRKCEMVYIRARYTFGKRVDGMLSLSATIKGVGYYKESTGPTVALTREIHGVAAMNVCIHQMMDGLWNAGDHFRGLLHIEAAVTTPDGATVKVSDSSCPVTKHLIDLEFTRNTRPHFKPGLPYKGRLRVAFPDGSAADNITVRVQADVNGENFVARDYLSKGGIINFGMPALPQAAQSVWLEAKVIKIGPDVVDDHYFPTYMSIGSWYSPSKCHTLIEGKPVSHKVGQVAKFYVHSTCPCNFTMYHEVMSRGNIVHSGIHIARHVRKRSVHFEELGAEIEFDELDEDVPTEHEYGDIKICTMFVKFVVTHEMAPISRLLVYYVRENGEGVADSFMFRVTPKYKNHLSVGVSKRVALPGEDVRLHVSTSPESHVCVSAVDKSVHLLRPDFQLSTEDVFSEIENYDLTVDTGTDVHWWVRPRTMRRRRSALWWTAATAKDAHYAFEEVGLLVLTDKVRLHFRQGVGTHTGPVYHRPGPGYYQVASMGRPWQHNNFKSQTSSRQRKRSFFPETWIWRCFNASTDTVVTVQAPDTITTWQLEGLSLSQDRGLALADPVQLRTYKAFFVDFKLPYSVVRGEQVKIPLTVYNYLHSCVRVHLTIVSPSGVVVVPTNDIEKLCVGAEESQTVTSVFVFSGLGHHQISAEAKAYEDSRCCSGSSSDVPADQSTVAYDHVTQKVLCEPEGVPRQYVYSVFFCPNERIHLTTPNKYEFQYIRKPDGVTSLTFSARAHNDVRVSLSTVPSDNDDMYEIVIGGWSNSQSWIAIGKEGRKLNIVDSKDIVSNEEFHTFWVSWADGVIQVGEGEDMTNDTILVEASTGSEVVVNYLGFSTGWGSDGEFRILKSPDMEGTYGEVFAPMIPENLVPGSEKAVASIIGDVMGPSIEHLGRLLSLPHGCGEQNMVNFAPNTYVLTYLHRTGQLTADYKAHALEDLVKGYQRQLTYRRDDGSYSAFGDRDPVGNMWLTAFVLRSFSQARKYIYVDDGEMARAVTWIISHQRRDGHFPPTGRLINKHIQGGVTSKLSLTAFVTTALLEASDNTKEIQISLGKAQGYIQSHLHLADDPYTAALTSYTLTLLNSEHAGTLLKSLNQQSTKRDGYTHWVLRDNLISASARKGREKVLAAEVETAGYALLTLLHHGRVASALPVVKWLSQQRNPQGGFISTQDTCVALQALSEYAALVHSRRVNLTVSLASTNMDLQERFVLTGENSAVLQTTSIPSIPEGLFVNAVGEGCALLQIDVSYNVAEPSEEPAFSLDIRLGKQRSGQRNKTQRSNLPALSAGGLDDFRVTIEICTRWRHHGSSNMAVLEVALLSGFQPDKATLNKLLSHGHLKLKRYEIENKKVLFYFDEIRDGCLTCVSFEIYRTYVVGKTQPVPVRIYDYYEPGYEATTFYNASNIGHLTEELCEDEICNEIKEDVAMPESDEDCNSIFGCYGGDPAVGGEWERCSCYRDCAGSGARVCGSDGLLHPNLCRLEVEACRQGLHLAVVPMALCNQELPGGSGDVTEDGDETFLVTLSPSEEESSNTSSVTPTVREGDWSTGVAGNSSDPYEPTTEAVPSSAGGKGMEGGLTGDNDRPKDMTNQDGSSHVSLQRPGSTSSDRRVVGLPAGTKRLVGHVGAQMTGLNALPGDTAHDTAKNVGKESQSAENETFGKSVNEQNDTLYGSSALGDDLGGVGEKWEALHGHVGQSNSTTTGQDVLIDTQRANSSMYSNTTEGNSTEASFPEGRNVTFSDQDIGNGTVQNDTQQKLDLNDKPASNVSSSSNTSQWNMIKVENYDTPKPQEGEVDQRDTGQQDRLKDDFKLVDGPDSSNLTSPGRWRDAGDSGPLQPNPT